MHRAATALHSCHAALTLSTRTCQLGAVCGNCGPTKASTGSLPGTTRTSNVSAAQRPRKLKHTE
eukprot:6492673-Amphidinium_carterae.1